MAKGQMRSNKEKKKPKQDKNKKEKGGAAPSPFASAQGQARRDITRTARSSGRTGFGRCGPSLKSLFNQP